MNKPALVSFLIWYRNGCNEKQVSKMNGILLLLLIHEHKREKKTKENETMQDLLLFKWDAHYNQLFDTISQGDRDKFHYE